MASVQHKVRSAALRGATEIMVLRFPCALRTWPETLTGRPRQAYEFWRDHLRPAGYRLNAMIIEWPGGLPGDVRDREIDRLVMRGICKGC